MNVHPIPSVSITALLVALLFASCSGNTIYRLTIDGLSFLEEDTRSGSIIIEASSEKYLYFLPHYGSFDNRLADDGTLELRHGFLVEYPVPSVPESETGELSLTIRAVFEIEHSSGSGPIDGSAAVFIADTEAENVYAEGQKIAESTISSPLEQGKADKINIEAQIANGDPGYDLIADGSFRCGVELILVGSAGANTEVSYEVEELFLRLDTRPFSFIP